MGNVVALCDLYQSLAGISARNRFPTLMARQFRLAAHHHPLGFGELPAFACTAADQFAFELGEAAQDALPLFPVGGETDWRIRSTGSLDSFSAMAVTRE